MKKIFVFVIMAILFVSVVMATKGILTTTGNKINNNNNNDINNNNNICGNQGFNCECQEFYKNDTHYYAIAKLEYDCGKKNYVMKEQNPLYRYFNINVNGNLKAANWTSDPAIYSVLVKAGNNRTAFSGGTSGAVTSIKDISHITFCGYKNDGGNGGCVGNNCNGVPEYSTLALGAAVLTVTLGLIFLMKK